MLDAADHGEFCIGAAYNDAARCSHVIACKMETPAYRRRAGVFDFYGPDLVTGQPKQQVNFSPVKFEIVAPHPPSTGSGQNKPLPEGEGVIRGSKNSNIIGPNQ